MIIANANGRSFFVRLVLKGQAYGLDDRLTHDRNDPLVEFYDMKYANVRSFGPRGQFVSRYYVSTLAKHPKGAGICLDGGVPEWSVDAAALAPILAVCAGFDELAELANTPARSEVTFNYEGGDCTLVEFLKSNLETLRLDEILKVARLSVGEVARIPAHCGFAQIVRTK